MRNPLSRFFDHPAAASDDAGQPSLQVAACTILLELAYADGEFTEPEQRFLVQALSRHFGLDGDAATALIEAADRRRRAAIDDFALTQEIVHGYDLGQKMVLAEVMWGIVLADGTVADHEAYLLRKLANLLDLEPAYLSQARRKAAEAREGS